MLRRVPAALQADQAHFAFVATGVTFAVVGGFALAVALPIDAARGFSLGGRWLALAQAHGHLQTVGFAGLVIFGVALRVAPRFAGTRLRHPGLVPATFVLIVPAVLLRAAGQALAERSPFGAVMAAGAWLEVGAAIAFGWAVLESSRGGIRRGDPSAVFLAAGCFWFLVQALFGAIWLSDLAADGRTALPADRDALLLFLQVFGFHLMFVLGVGLRALPTFFGHDAPTPQRALAAFSIAQAGIALMATALAWRAVTGDVLWRAEDAALLLLATGLIAAVVLTGSWGTPHRLRPGTQPIGRLPQAAMGWLVIASGLLVFFAIRALAESRGLLGTESDAVRHLVGLGVVTMAIVGMAHIVLPEFAVERLTGRSGRRRAWLFGLGLSLAAVMRTAPGIADRGASSTGDYWLMAAAGIIGLALIGWFGWLLWRAWREQPLLLQEVATRARQGARPPRSPT